VGEAFRLRPNLERPPKTTPLLTDVISAFSESQSCLMVLMGL
jgi:hypothetical protein